MSKIHVREVETKAELEALYSFRYRIYVEELSMTDQADHARQWLQDGYDEESVHYAIFKDGNIVGSLRCTGLDDVSDPNPLIAKFEMEPALKAFGASAIITTSRFMVSSELRNAMAMLNLMVAAFQDTRRGKIRLNFGDCSPHLLPFYEHLGYRRYTDGFVDSAYGYKLPIMMLVGDRQFFEQMRSPLASLLKPEDDDAEARAWFADTYVDYIDPVSAAFMPDDLFFDLLAEKLANDPLHSMALLKGLNQDEAKRFLRRATVINLKAGDTIIRQGDRDNTLFVMLSGVAEVHTDGSNGPSIAVFAAGDTFGEIGFLTSVPRTANVIARTDSEVLVLSGSFIERLVKAEPSMGARVLNNLARELAGRLAITTKGYAGLA